MKTRQQYVDAYHAAMQAERELWERLEGKGPGQPGYDPQLFKQWLNAVAATNVAAKAVREAFSDGISGDPDE
jgi:hypothetical protein